MVLVPLDGLAEPWVALQSRVSLGRPPVAEKPCVLLKATDAELGVIPSDGPPIAPAQTVRTTSVRGALPAAWTTTPALAAPVIAGPVVSDT